MTTVEILTDAIAIVGIILSGLVIAGCALVTICDPNQLEDELDDVDGERL